jgi:glycerol-3-phosphate dehydrogenase
MAIAKYVVKLLKEKNLLSSDEKSHKDIKMPTLGEAFKRPYQDDEKIRLQNGYGEIICHCEKVTKQEIIDALNSEIPPRTINGLSRRTRACLGRCQGFYCSSEIRKLIEESFKSK